MTSQLLVFQDFHIRGASAPEWNQKYLQMSSGVMRSTLHEWSMGRVHVFGKWISERVVQQGSLPRGKLCFALLGNDPRAAMRVQGQEFGVGHLFVLRGGQEFEFQRPAGAQMLSVTFDVEAFSEFLDASQFPMQAHRMSAAAVIRPDAKALDALRGHVLARISAPAGRAPDDFMEAVRRVLAQGCDVPRQRASSGAAASMVKESQRIALAEAREQPPRIDELCGRLRTSRRTLQDSFRRVTGASPVVYLRNLRLNAVRRRLMSTTGIELSVSHAAMDAGFEHLGRFSGSYKALFGESPSQTTRGSSHLSRE